jgi:hypothetical protein
MSTCSVPNRLGSFGTVHQWPQTDILGECYSIDQVYPKYPGKCEKYYAVGEMDEGWCALRNDNDGYTVKLTYPAEQLPYLGIWEGIMDGEYVTALEPCTGSLDALDTALQWKQVRAIPPYSSYNWELAIRVGIFAEA